MAHLFQEGRMCSEETCRDVQRLTRYRYAELCGRVPESAKSDNIVRQSKRVRQRDNRVRQSDNRVSIRQSKRVVAWYGSRRLNALAIIGAVNLPSTLRVASVRLLQAHDAIREPNVTESRWRSRPVV
jgi:hypothetical protein